MLRKAICGDLAAGRGLERVGRSRGAGSLCGHPRVQGNSTTIVAVNTFGWPEDEGVFPRQAIYTRESTDMLPAPRRCFFPGCGKFPDHDHHIVYFPDEVKKPLCRSHHEEITIINGQQARKYRHGLSNNHRWWIWHQWLEGKLRPRRTRKALEYIEEWDRSDLGQTQSRITMPVVLEGHQKETGSSGEMHLAKKKVKDRTKKTNTTKSRKPSVVHKGKLSQLSERRKKKPRKKQKPRR
jgi:hypothetical protein